MTIDSPLEQQHRLKLVATGIVLLLAASLAATILLTPAYALPAGVAVSDGDSMGHDSQRVIVYADTGDVSAGDRIVFDAGYHGYLHHRAVEETGHGYVTQGDAESKIDQISIGDSPPAPYATEQNIRGVTVATVSLEAVQVSILGVLALLGLAGAAIYRRRLSSTLPRARASFTVVTPRARQFVAVLFGVLLAVSLFGSGVILLPGVEYDHAGTAAAESPSSADVIYMNNNTRVWARYQKNHSVIWEANPTTLDNNGGIAVDPNEQVVYSTDGDKIHTLYAGNGTTKYSVSPVDANSFRGVAHLPGKDQFVAVGSNSSSNGLLYIGNSNDGSEAYSETFTEKLYYLAVGANGEHLYIGTTGTNELFKYDIANKSVEWRVTTGADQGIRELIANPDGSAVYMAGRGTDANSNYVGMVEGYHASNGTTIWSNQESLETSFVDVMTNYEGTEVYVAGNTEHNYILDPADGSEISKDNRVHGQAIPSHDGSEILWGNQTEYQRLDAGTYGELFSTASSVNHEDIAHSSYMGGSYTTGVRVDGQVTDSGGNPINAKLTLEKDGSEVASTSTNDSGGYKFSNIDDGTYTLTAEATGYVSNSTTIEVAGAPVTHSFSLNELSVGGQIVGCEITDPGCKDPDPVSYATAVVWGVNHTAVEEHFDGVTNPTEAEEKAKEIREEAETIEPPDWQSDLTFFGQGGKMSTADQPYVAVHEKSQWGLTGFTDRADLRPPRLTVEPGEIIVLSAWDPAEEDLTQDGVNKQLPGETMDDETLVVEQLGPGKGEVTDRREYQLDSDVQARSVGVIRPNKHAIVKTQLPEGYYRVYVKGSDVSYVIKVGEPFAGVVRDLRDEAGNLVDKAQKIRDWENKRIMERKAVTADENGRWAVNFSHDGVQTVGVYAYKADSKLDPTSSRSMLKQVRDARAQQNYNGSVYIPREPIHADVPSSGVQVRTTEFNAEPFAGLEELSDRMLAQIAGFLDATPEELRDIWNIPSGEWDGVVDDPTSGVGGDSGGDSVNDATQYLQDRYEQMVALAEETGAVEGNEPEWWNNRDEVPSDRGVLLSRIADLEAAIDYQSSSTQPDPEPPDPSDGELQAMFPFNGDVAEETVNVQVEWADGTISPVNDSYWRVEQTMNPLTGERVVVEGYPIPDGKTVGDIHVDAAVDDAAVSSRAGFTNPAYTGDVPAFRSIDVSKIQPGPSDTVQIEPRPRENTGYGQVTGITVYGPDGEAPSRVHSANESAEFETNGAGDYTVQLEYQAQDGTPFRERFTLQASDQSASVPPTVRAQSTVGGGYYALAGDGLRDATIEADESAGETRVTATIPADGSISELHVQARPAMTGDDLKVSVVQGSDQRTVRNHVAVVVHEDLSDDALVWRDDREPITRSGATQFGDIEEREGEKDLIRSYTDSRGQLKMTIKQDPGWWDARAHAFWSSGFVRSFSGLSLPGLLSPLETVVAWFGGLSTPAQIGWPVASMLVGGVAVGGRVHHDN